MLKQENLVSNMATIFVLIKRECIRTAKQPSRMLGIIMQPLLFWLIMGSGFVSSFKDADGANASYAAFFFPGMIAMVMLFSTIFNTITLIEDRNSGFMQTVLVGPASRASIAFGKIAAVALISFVQISLLLVLAPYAGFRVEAFGWSYGLLLMICGTLSLAGVGFIMAWLSQTTSAYHALMSIILMPFWLISGAVFPLENSWLKYTAVINPLSWIVVGLRAFLDPLRESLTSETSLIGASNALWLTVAFCLMSLFVATVLVQRKNV